MENKKNLEHLWKLEIIKRIFNTTYFFNLLLYLIAVISDRFSDSLVSMLFASFSFFLCVCIVIYIICKIQYYKLSEAQRFEFDCKKYPDMAEAFEADSLVESYLDKPIQELIEQCHHYANVEIGNNVLVLHNKYRYQITLRFNDTILSFKELPNRHVLFKNKNIPFKNEIKVEDFRNTI